MRLYIVRTIVKTIYCCFSTLGFIVMGISTFKGDARYVDAVKKFFHGQLIPPTHLHRYPNLQDALQYHAYVVIFYILTEKFMSVFIF